MQERTSVSEACARPPRGEAPARPAWHWVGERALRVESGESTLALYAVLHERRFSELEDVVVADGSLLLVLRRGMPVSADLWAALTAAPDRVRASAGSLHIIEVEYGGAAGPDLATLAALAGLDEARYVQLHGEVDYLVSFIGFQPGFPYLSGLPHALHAPRRSTPRTQVPAGSVAIGGAYTGIYPGQGPGGWQIIGRTAARLFDAESDQPALLLPGDRVRFVPV